MFRVCIEVALDLGVHSVAVVPALSLIAGVLAGLFIPWGVRAFLVPMVVAGVLGAAAWARGWGWPTTAALVTGFVACGAANAAHAREQALHSPLRQVLDAGFGGFDLASRGPAGEHAPVPTRARITEDGVLRDGFASVRVGVLAVRLRGVWREAPGGVVLSVSGAASPTRVAAWRAGRTIEAPVTYRRPARYLNDGVADFERDLALDGTTLLGSVKSALLVDVTARGTWLQEAAGEARAHVRDTVGRWVGVRDATSAALVTAVLIGDRAAIPDDVRERLQISGTYHVIAISGGNIAVFVVIVSALCRLGGLGPRAAALATLLVLLAYAAVVVSGPSVRRAVVVAVIYLVARALDHRSPPWHAGGMACAGLLVAWPLDLRDVGFVLTFGAAAALVASANVLRSENGSAPARWLLHSIGASVAVEIVLLPVQALAFGRVSLAGVVLNLVAVPAMTLGQLAGLAVVCVDAAGLSAWTAGWVAHAGVKALVEAASLVELAPGVADRSPPPHWVAVAVYYVALGATVRAARSMRVASAGVGLAAAWLMTHGSPATFSASLSPPPGQLRLTMFDVGQAEAILLEPPGSAPLLVDTGGSPFGSGLDIGTRVVAPASWARGVTALSALVVTHGDPDHLGGAAGVLESLRVGAVWFGIRVPSHVATNDLLATLLRRRIGVGYLRARRTLDAGGARIRVLHPEEPDWERPRVRNDDSVVVEIVYGEVAILLTGDISAAVERTLVPRLTPARVRILKVPHHGSRTSTSQALIDGWRPELALISAGRGNSFGHPAREVLDRLEQAGARVLRTDWDGQITIETDGRNVTWRTFTGATSPTPPSSLILEP